LVLFSGPHKASVAMEEYKNIIIIASGFGIVAHLPYLKQLIYGHNTSKTKVHLVWQIQDKTEAALIA
jgi:NAD(P)H-flavin reductase